MNLKTITKPNQILTDPLYNSFLEINSKTTLPTILNATFLVKTNNNHYYLSRQRPNSVYFEVDISKNSKLENIKLLIKINNFPLLSILEKTNFITTSVDYFSYKECCELLKGLDLAPQEELIRQCIKITKFPIEFLSNFKKNHSISIKQLFYYDRFDHHFLTWYSKNIISPFKLSFSQFNAFLDQLYSLKKRSIKEFEICINEINNLDKTTKNSQIKLKDIIYQASCPIIYKANKLIEKRIEELNLPDKISISWDKSLENKQLNISISCNKNEDMKLLDSLKEKQSEINNLLKNFGYENS